MYSVKHFINNQFVDSLAGETFDVLTPLTNEVIGHCASGQAADIDKAAKAARAAFDSGVWSRMPAAERAKKIRKIGDLILKHAHDIAELEIVDTGIPRKQITKGAIPRAADNFYFFADQLLALHGKAYPVDQEWLNYVVYRPMGVAGLITPWNTPFMLETWKVAPCLASGCTAVLKPAEWSPLSASKLCEIIQEADLPPGVFNCVHGFGESAGAPLVAHPDVNLISFTGETTTGQIIIKNGADTLKRFSMELGGKSPNIVFADADLDRAIDGALWQVYSLNGERCTAASRLLVEQSIHDEFVARLAARVKQIKVGDPNDMSTEVGPLIHQEHWQRVRDYMDIARADGATILVGGDRPAVAVPPSKGGPPGGSGAQQGGVDFGKGNYFLPTLITNVRNNMRIAQEEVFGPVLAVMPFADEAEAIQLANDIKFGLAGYIWTSNVTRAHRVAQSLECGMVWINSHNVRDLRTPFGGSKWSGIGREGGQLSFTEFYMDTKIIHVPLGEHHIPKIG
ncbi:5-carboxymethyl-2-hydroxymuconate semialdehyde dehydrogenase [candidate division KSB1 bacterium]|nr:5-carboxymethyl-2-hydroxymuconate semialdehyde dehydrogenase [candidate division KSB1 bacterium]